MSDTPRTDAETRSDDMDHVDTEFGPFAPSDTVSADFARALERELAEAIRERDNAISDWRQADTDSIRAIHERNEARAEVERLGVAGIHSCHAECPRYVCTLRRERDALADALREIASGLHDWKTCVDKIAPEAIAKLKP